MGIGGNQHVASGVRIEIEQDEVALAREEHQVFAVVRRVQRHFLAERAPFTLYLPG